MIQKIQKFVYNQVVNKYFSPDCSNYNSLEVRRTCRSKEQGRDMFEKHNIPHAHGEIFFNPFRAVAFVKKNGFPVVIKPNISSFSRGSYFPITTHKELWRAMFFARLYWPRTVIEQYATGNNYRITVLDGNIIAASERFEPFVDGDGKHSIAELMKIENDIREKMKLYPVMHELVASSQVRDYLKKQDLTLESIPKKDERIKLFHRVALSPGGIVKNIDVSTITEKNRALSAKILDVFGARIFGIDLIMEKGPHIDWDKQKCAVLEVNSRPYMKLHEYPRYGDKPDMSGYYAELDSLEINDKDVF